VPEGDTVWFAARRLERVLTGRTLLRTDFRVPRYATSDLSGRVVLNVASRGKHLLTRIDGGITLHTHFKMEGAWRVYRPGQRWSGRQHEVRVVLYTAEHVCVGSRLAIVELVPTGDESAVVGHLGPDLLAADWGPGLAHEACRRLLAQPDREIGNALLDQRNLAGLGNRWRCEVLFLRGISPYLRVGDVSDLPRLVELSHRALASGRDGSSYVYGRSGQPCRRCHTLIAKAPQSDEVGGLPTARDAYWCPHCQPGPPPAATRLR
jgi:endonuclease-8